MATKLNEKAILIKVELKKWGGTKVDKGLSKEIADKHDVDSKHFFRQTFSQTLLSHQ